MTNLDLIDLDYEDAEPVRLDVAAIVRRGSRLRRKRLAARAALAVLVLALIPGAVTVNLSRLSQERHSVVSLGTAGPRDGERRPAQSGGTYGGLMNGNGIDATPHQAPIFGMASLLVPLSAEVKVAVTLPSGYGPVHDLTGSRSGRGAWFWASAARQVRLFRISGTGQLSSWPVPGAITELAVRPDGQVAVAVRHVGGGLVLSPATGKLRPARRPSAGGSTGSRLAPLPDGQFAALTPGEIEVFPSGMFAARGSASYYRLPRVRCARARTCPLAPGELATDSAGDIWAASLRTVVRLSLPA
jgi:hypothetical protein